MTVYQSISIMIMFGILIVSILSFNRKK
ncbi:putative holin-like toxin [Chengkuizengella sp. SCS-71B]